MSDEICDRCKKYKANKELLRNLILEMQRDNNFSYAQIYNLLEEIQLELFSLFIQQYVIPSSEFFQEKMRTIIDEVKKCSNKCSNDCAYNKCITEHEDNNKDSYKDKNKLKFKINNSGNNDCYS